MPLAEFLPKVWTQSLPFLQADGARTVQEAYTPEEFGTMHFENPGFWTAPFGFWVWPRPARRAARR